MKHQEQVKSRCAEETSFSLGVYCVHLLSLQHPQIQKESQYIKYLCCDDAWTLNLWVTGIRIAKVTFQPSAEKQETASY